MNTDVDGVVSLAGWAGEYEAYAGRSWRDKP